MDFRRVTVDKLGIDVVTHDPVILLTCEETKQVVPIVVGIFEATSIAFALEDHELPRPIAHDLIKSIIENLDADLLRVEIYSLENDTYYCNLILKNKDGEEIEVDCRPSDAIAVALRMHVDIYMADELLDKATSHMGGFTATCEDNPDGSGSQVIMRSTEQLESDSHVDATREMEVDDFLDNMSFDGLNLGDDPEDKDNGPEDKGK